MHGCHTLSARLDDRDLSNGIRGGSGRVFLVKSVVNGVVSMKMI
jgi:hypothetical protein